MWKWIVRFFKSLAPESANIKQLPAPLTHNNIVVKEIEISSDVFKEKLIKSAITKVYDTKSAPAIDLQALCEHILAEVLPVEYKYAVKNHHDNVILVPGHFKNSANVLNKCYPLLKKELSKIGIERVSQPIRSSIFINTDNITRAVGKWEKLGTYL